MAHKFAPKFPYHAPVRTGLPLIEELDQAIRADERTQGEILKAAGLSINTFNIWKRGDHSPTLMNLSVLAQVLRCRIVLQPEENSNA